jgi:hypothetical protein
MSRALGVAVAALILLFPLAVEAQQSADDLAQAAANPIADLISIPLQNNVNGGFGDFDRISNILNIQPVIPLMEGRLITRTIIPVVWLPDFASESGSLSTGLADIVFTAFYVPPTDGVMVGFGPVVQLPTGGDIRGSGKWGLGPSFVALAQPGAWTFGILVNNVWSVAGDEDRDDYNKGLIQYFVVRQLGNGWYVNSAPIINVDWKAAEGQKWIVPFGVGAGKVFTLGRLPVNGQVGYFYNVVKPDFGPDWQFRVQFQLLLPTSLFGGGEE